VSTYQQKAYEGKQVAEEKSPDGMGQLKVLRQARQFVSQAGAAKHQEGGGHRQPELGDEPRIAKYPCPPAPIPCLRRRAEPEGNDNQFDEKHFEEEACGQEEPSAIR
jgi:hypothetical protein